MFYLLAVVAFCVINWRLLMADKSPTPPPAREFESMVVEAMLDEMGSVSIPENRSTETRGPDLSVSDEHGLILEDWMISPKTFSRSDTEGDLVLQEWMIDLSSWGLKQP
jgi:hypothetical protein